MFHASYSHMFMSHGLQWAETMGTVCKSALALTFSLFVCLLKIGVQMARVYPMSGRWTDHTLSFSVHFLHSAS